MLSRTISVRLSDEILENLENRGLVENKDRAELIRDALVTYLRLPKDSVEERIRTLTERNELMEKRVSAIEKVIQEVENSLKTDRIK